MKMKDYESDGSRTFIFGGEESYGYLPVDFVRDKDAVSAAVVTAEMALYHRSRGKTLVDRLDEIYAEYGYFQELLISRYFEGAAGSATMLALMERLRSDPPATLAGQGVATVRDYRDGSTRDASGVKRRDIDLPSSNVLQFILDDDTIITARPSGTEPKIKFYASCCTGPGADLSRARAEVQRKIQAVSADLDRLIAAGATPA
jgi:phosphoglucomutase